MTDIDLLYYKLQKTFFKNNQVMQSYFDADKKLTFQLVNGGIEQVSTAIEIEPYDELTLLFKYPVVNTDDCIMLTVTISLEGETYSTRMIPIGYKEEAEWFGLKISEYFARYMKPGKNNIGFAFTFKVINAQGQEATVIEESTFHNAEVYKLNMLNTYSMDDCAKWFECYGGRCDS